MKKLTVFIALIAFFGLSLLNAQTRTVTGTVTSSEDGMGIPGVNVIVKGTTVGTPTDIDGKYTINVPEGYNVLSFDALGFTTQEVTITGSVINVVLQSSNIAIDEVMVVAYGTAKKSSFTGSAATVKADKIASLPVASIDQAISGMVAGVEVSGGSGQPGSTSSVRIRGVGSINSSNDPLYVIDGIPVTSGGIGTSTTSSLSALSTLNQSDIESFTVLKDAAAAALYGSRAANGVILITTKKGKSGETQFSARADFGWNDFATPLPELATPAQALQYKAEGYMNANPGEYTNLADCMSDLNTYIFDQYDSSRPDSDYDWDKKLFRVGKSSNYEVSASGGNDKTTFFTSFKYDESEGVAVGSDFQRYTVRLNLDHKANDIVSFGFNNNMSRLEQNSIPSSGLYYKNPVWATRSYLHQLLPVYDNDGKPSIINGGDYPNLVGDIGKTIQKNVNWRVMSKLYGELDLYKGLKFRSTVGFDFINTDGDQYWSPISSDGEGYNGYASESVYYRQQLTNSNILTYNTTINDNHNIDILAGFEMEKVFEESISADGQNFPNDFLSTLDVSAKPLGASNSKDYKRMNSWLTRVNYDYANKYYISGSFRRDGSSQLGENNRWGNFWSVSGSWRLTEEDFLKGISWLNDWKVRASYGVNGTLPTAWHGHLALYGYGFDYNGIPGSFNTQVENPNLRWEKNGNLSIATEFKIFDFLTTEIEYFNRTTSDLLLEVRISRVTGFEKYWDNVGEMNNQGFELTFNSLNVQTKDFMWSTTLNLYTYKNEIVKLYNGEDIQDFPFILREGESFNTFYLRDWAGPDPTTGLPTWYVVDENEQRTGETTTDFQKAGKTIVGKSDPDFVGSLSNTLSYKGFDLSFMFSFKVGGKSYGDQSWTFQSENAYVTRVVTKEMFDKRWQKAGDDEFPIHLWGSSVTSNNNSSRRLNDASYLRLKNITLGYTLPKNIVQKVRLSSMKVFASAVNPWTLAAYDQYDPETSSRGVGFLDADFPPMKSVTLGVEIKF